MSKPKTQKPQQKKQEEKKPDPIRPGTCFWIEGEGKGDIRREIQRANTYIEMMAEDWPQDQKSYNKWAQEKMAKVLAKIAENLGVRLPEKVEETDTDTDSD